MNVELEGGGEGERVSWRELMPPPPLPALEAHSQMFGQIIRHISKSPEPFAHYESKTGQCSIPDCKPPKVTPLRCKAGSVIFAYDGLCIYIPAYIP